MLVRSGMSPIEHQIEMAQSRFSSLYPRLVAQSQRQTVIKNGKPIPPLSPTRPIVVIGGQSRRVQALRCGSFCASVGLVRNARYVEVVHAQSGATQRSARGSGLASLV